MPCVVLDSATSLHTALVLSVVDFVSVLHARSLCLFLFFSVMYNTVNIITLCARPRFAFIITPPPLPGIPQGTALTVQRAYLTNVASLATCAHVRFILRMCTYALGAHARERLGFGLCICWMTRVHIYVFVLCARSKHHRGGCRTGLCTLVRP